ncbi:hypothetical protein SMICM304S_07292 [Streptomyces microflavus]
MLAGDLLLEELAHGRAVLGGPDIGRAAQPLPGRGEPSGGLAGCPPHQPQPHAGGGRPLLQFDVHVPHLPLGRADQLLERPRDLRDQVGLKDLPLPCGQDAGQFTDLDRQGRGQVRYGSFAALIRDVDDHAVLHHPGGRPVSVPGQGVLEGLELLAQPALHPFPGAVGVVGGGQFRVDGAGQRDCGGRGPCPTFHSGHLDVRHRHGHQSGGGEPLECGNRLRTRLGRLRQPLVQLFDSAFSPARGPVGLGVTPVGGLLLALADARRLRGPRQHALKLVDGGAHRGTQGAEAFVGRRRLVLRILRALRELCGTLGSLSGVGTLVGDLAAGLTAFAQGGPEGCQHLGQGAQCVTYRRQPVLVGRHPQVLCGPGEFLRRRLAPAGRLQKGRRLAPPAVHRSGAGIPRQRLRGRVRG